MGDDARTPDVTMMSLANAAAPPEIPIKENTTTALHLPLLKKRPSEASVQAFFAPKPKQYDHDHCTTPRQSSSVVFDCFGWKEEEDNDQSPQKQPRNSPPRKRKVKVSEAVEQ